MKTISKFLMVIVMMIAGVNSASAQSDYLLNFGPGSSSWCWQQQQQINAMSMQNTLMRAQIMNYYRQQAVNATQQLLNNPFQPMQGIVTYDGTYVTPENVNTYSKEKIDCDNCNGRGYNYRTIYTGRENKVIKIRCSFCHGSGKVVRMVVGE